MIALKRNDEAPAVLPTPENVRNRTYPLSHYLYWYVVGTPQGVARDLIRFATSPEGQFP